MTETGKQLFEIDFQEDPIPRKVIVRIRDATRYVQDTIEPREWRGLHGESWDEVIQRRRKVFDYLCEKWEIQFGQRIKSIPPEGPGIGWRIVHDE